MGNVEIENHKGERFNTELLYWNQVPERVCSDRFIRIEQPDRIIEGEGFDSNQQLTVYQIHSIKGIFYVDEEQPQQPIDTVPLPRQHIHTDTLTSNPIVE